MSDFQEFLVAVVFAVLFSTVIGLLVLCSIP
jgi:hypothetical protein